MIHNYVGSVANYVCEVWETHRGPDIEKVHLEFRKYIDLYFRLYLQLGVKKSIPSAMVYFELRRIPMCSIRKLRILKYWCKLIST